MSSVLTLVELMGVEDNMRSLSENESDRLTLKQWWQYITRVVSSKSRREIIMWLLSTAQITRTGHSPNVPMHGLTMLDQVYENLFAEEGIQIPRSEFTDADGHGLDLAGAWSRDVSAVATYFPQFEVSKLLMNGHLPGATAYDGLPYFNIAHWLNPMDHGVGTYSNVITGVDISTAVSADTAVEHLQTVFGTIASIKMPNGLYPRRLRPAGILAGPTLFPQAAKLTGAQFIASASSGGGGGTTDLAGYVKGVLGFGTPWCADELAGFESDTTYFVVAEQLSSSQLGGLVYIEREPFHVTYYTGEGGGTGVSVDLDRTDTLEWHIKGRNVADYGHPYLIFKCTA